MDDLAAGIIDAFSLFRTGSSEYAAPRLAVESKDEQSNESLSLLLHRIVLLS